MNYFSNIFYMFSHIFLMMFIYLFSIYRYSKIKTILVCFGAFVSLCSLDLVKLTFYPDSNTAYFVVTVLQIIITQFTAVFISARRNSRSVFMGLTSSNYVIAGSIMAPVLYIWTGNVLISLIGSFATHLSILFLLSFRTRKIWLWYLEKEFVSGGWGLCLIPVFFYCGFSCLTFFPYTLYDHPENILATLVFIVTMFVSYIVVLRYMESESQKADIYWKNTLYESYIDGLENQYYIVEKSEQNMKILRHDMRHYSGMINSLLDQEEYEEIRRIAEHINEVMDENKVTKYCNNLILNTIFANLMETARIQETEVHHDIQIGGNLCVNSYELAMVMANLFENSLDCVKNLDDARRYVDIKLHCTEEYLLVQTKNPYESEIKFDLVSGLPVSSKGENHGFGMQSVKTFSDKTGGSMDCYCKDGIFYFVIFAKF